MGNSTLTLEALFGDLNLEVGLEPEPREESLPPQALPGRFAFDAESVLDAVGFTTASALLSDSADPRSGRTRPYEVPEDEFAQTVTLWGDDERFSTLSTTPVCLDELPEEAYPPRFTLLELD